MTFSVMMLKGDQPRVVGMLWANDQASAEAIAPQMCGGADGDRVQLRITEDREIPLRIASPQSIYTF
jgi:hypothetical protein